MVTSDKHPNLLRKLANYVRKRFYNIEPCGMYYKSFMIVIYNCNV